MATPKTQSALAALDNFYNLLQNLAGPPSDADLSQLESFFTENCSCNLRSMREFPILGRQACIQDLKDLLQTQKLLTRRVLSQSAYEDAAADVVVFCQMSNKIDILGTTIDPWQETIVVRFEGESMRMREFRTYSCRSPIVRVVQEKTREGPYSVEHMAVPEYVPGLAAPATGG